MTGSAPQPWQGEGEVVFVAAIVFLSYYEHDMRQFLRLSIYFTLQDTFNV